MFGIKRGFLPEVDYATTYQPKTGRIWAKKLFSEFLGTIYLSYVIGLLGVRMKNGIKFEFLITGDNGTWVSHVVVGLWVAADILVCLLLFSKVSCDLNPAISFYRWLSKEQTATFVMSKVATQMVAAVATAGLLILTQYFVQLSTNDPLNFVSNAGHVTDALSKDTGLPTIIGAGQPLVSQYSAFINDGNIGVNGISGDTAGKHFAAVGGEMIGAFLLIWAIFSRKLSSHGMRLFTIVLVVFLGVASLLEINTVGWNPARSLATNAAFDITSGSSEGMQIYWAYVVGPIGAALLMYYGTVFFDRHMLRIWDKLVFWKNIE